MTVLKASELAGYLRQRDLKANAFLVHGADAGKVHETARALVQRIAGRVDDPFCVVRIKEDELSDDPGRLADEFLAVAMLGGARAVWVSEAGSAFAAAVKGLLGQSSGGNAVVAEAGYLRRGTQLLTLFERAEGAYAIACYPDRDKDLAEVIGAMVQEAGIAITRDAKALLVDFLGDDRSLTRSEIEKLIVYTHGQKEITAADVAAVCSGRLDPPLDELCDAVLGGDVASADRLIHIFMAGGTTGSRLLAVAANHIALLRGLAGDVAAGTPVARAIDGAQPPIFWTRKSEVAEQLRRWPDGALSGAASTVAEATLATRQMPALEPQIASRALLAIARRAGRLRHAEVG